jgi:site-specific recombinase XerD
LAQYIEEINGRGTGYLFSKAGGSSPISRQTVNKMLKQLEGINPEVEDVYPHKLRHSFATNLRAAGAELVDI